jgi:hypothetical protein
MAIKDRLKLAGRTADDLEHVGSRGLLPEGLTQLAEQSRILNCDDCLGGECIHKFNLLVGERLHYWTREHEHTYRNPLSQHRDAEIAAITSQFLAF